MILFWVLYGVLGLLLSPLLGYAIGCWIVGGRSGWKNEDIGFAVFFGLVTSCVWPVILWLVGMAVVLRKLVAWRDK